MEHIKNIEIKNFKSIRHGEIKDCRRVNVFIGEPNVGKSNILEALGLFSINDPSISFSSFVRMENLTTIFFDGNIQERLEVKLNRNHRYIAKIQDDSLKFEWQYASDATIFENEGLDLITPLNDSSITLKQSFELKEGNGTMLNFKNPNFTEIKFGHILSDVLKYEFKKDIDYISSSYINLLPPYGNNIFEILSSIGPIRKDISEIFKKYNLKFSFDTSTRTFKILKDIGDDIFLISYSMIADTLQRLIFYKTAILSNKGTVLLFEEPEAHMFPPYISKFTSDIIYDKNENQYFIATHSPFVINDFMEELKNDELAIYLISYKKETGETIIDKMNKEEMHEAYQFGYDFFLNMKNFIPANR